MKIHYHLHSNEYEDWSLWIWQEREGDEKPEKELQQNRKDTFGAVFELKDRKWLQFGKIVVKPRQGKGWLNDQNKEEIEYSMSKPSSVKEIWIVQGNSEIYQKRPDEDILVRAKEIFNQRKGESAMATNQANAKKDEGKKAEVKVDATQGKQNKPNDSQQDTPEVLNQDLKKAKALIDELEGRVLTLKTEKIVGETTNPSDDFKFAKKLIQTDIHMLEGAYRGLRELVLSIQERLEALNFTLSNEQKKIHDDYEQKINDVDEKATKGSGSLLEKIENDVRGVKDEFGSELGSIRTQIDQSAGRVQQEIAERLTAEHSVINERIDRLEVFRSESENSMKQTKTEKEQSFKVLAQYILKLAQAAGHNSTLSKYGLDNAMKKIETSGSSM